MGLSGSEAKCAVRVLNVLSACCMIALGVSKFATHQSLSLRQQVWTAYWILFGILICIAEFQVGIILRYFAFLDKEFGKGLFIIFCGTCLIDSLTGAYTYESVLGIVMCVFGVITILLGCSGSDKSQGNKPIGIHT